MFFIVICRQSYRQCDSISNTDMTNFLKIHESISFSNLCYYLAHLYNTFAVKVKIKMRIWRSLQNMKVR